MKKIPTLFKRRFVSNHNFVLIKETADGMERILQGEGVATIKLDGSACAIFDGELYKRYDAKRGKPIPDGAIPCQEEPDKITGHFPCWVKCDKNNPADKWFFQAYYDSESFTGESFVDNATYEAIGKHFQGNPYGFDGDYMVRHGQEVVEVERTFEGIKKWLMEHPSEEGLVFWLDGEPVCKIRQKDYGLKWIGSKKIDFKLKI